MKYLFFQSVFVSGYFMRLNSKVCQTVGGIKCNESVSRIFWNLTFGGFLQFSLNMAVAFLWFFFLVKAGISFQWCRCTNIYLVVDKPLSQHREKTFGPEWHWDCTLPVAWLFFSAWKCPSNPTVEPRVGYKECVKTVERLRECCQMMATYSTVS